MLTTGDRRRSDTPFLDLGITGIIHGMDLMFAMAFILFGIPLLFIASPFLLAGWLIHRFCLWIDSEPPAENPELRGHIEESNRRAAQFAAGIRDRRGRRTDLGMWVS